MPDGGPACQVKIGAMNPKTWRRRRLSLVVHWGCEWKIMDSMGGEECNGGGRRIGE